MPQRILVVDDEPLKRITLQIELSEHGYEVYEAADAQAARRIFDAREIDVVVTDVRMPGMNGLDLLTYVKQTRPQVEVVLMTAYATVDTAVLAIKRGAYDYITKPFTTQDLLVKLERLLASRGPATETPAGPTVPADGVETCGRLVARSQVMKRLFEQVRSVAGNDRTILLCGESGTGKELLAEVIHAHSPAPPGRSSASVVRPCNPRCSRASCSATKRGRLPVQSGRKRAGSSWRAAGRCCWTRWTTFPPSCRSNCCGSSSSRSLSAWAARSRCASTCG